MTTCLRSLKLNLHPKIALINGRRSTSHAGLPKTHSNFLNEFLDNRLTWQAERSPRLATDLSAVSTVSRVGSTTVGSLSGVFVETHAIVKPLAVTPDDIVLSNGPNFLPSAGSWCSQRLLEDDMHRDVIHRENHSVTVLLGTAQPPAFDKSVLLSAGEVSKGQPPPAPDPTAKPTDEQLEFIYLRLSETLPSFFLKPLDYSIFHNRIVFENNIRGLTTHGISPYIQQMSLVRMVGHLKFAYVKMDILKVTKHPEDGTVRIRWRIRGIPALKVMLQFWKFRLWQYESSVKDKETVWYDGFSTFYIAGDGLIHRHVCDKMMPDEHKEKSTATIAAKLALLLGLLPRPSFDSLGAFTLTFTKLLDAEMHSPNGAK